MLHEGALSPDKASIQELLHEMMENAETSQGPGHCKLLRECVPATGVGEVKKAIQGATMSLHRVQHVSISQVESTEKESR